MEMMTATTLEMTTMNQSMTTTMEMMTAMEMMVMAAVVKTTINDDTMTTISQR